MAATRKNGLPDVSSWKAVRIEESWDRALSSNSRVPVCERARGARVDICLPNRTKQQLRDCVAFVKEESSIRHSQQVIPIGWRTLCGLSTSGYFLYTPRCTFPIFYFDSS